MSEYTISQVCPTDRTVLAQIDALLQQEGIRRDGNLDYICAMFDEAVSYTHLTLPTKLCV